MNLTLTLFFFLAMAENSITLGQETLFGTKVISSIGFDEQEMIRDILVLHNNGNAIECDPTYSIGNFYKKGLPKPKYKFDLSPQIAGVEKANANNLPLDDNSINSIMFDPPFLFGNTGTASETIMAKRFTMFDTFLDLENMYKTSLQEFHRILRPKGLLIFKCQDFTSPKGNIMIHNIVYNWASEIGFYAKDLFILFSKNRVFNPNVTQRHARKFHSYYWVFIKSVGKKK